MSLIHADAIKSSLKPRWMRGVALCALATLSACAVVNVSRLGSHDYVNERRVDIIGANRLSDRTLQTLNVVAFNRDSCKRDFVACSESLAHSPGLSNEQRFAALSELWLEKAIKSERARRGKALDEPTLDAFLQSARYAYAYLFFTERQPSDRPFDLRQIQVTDFYNFSVQHTVTHLFDVLPLRGDPWTQTTLAGWTIFRPQMDARLGGNTWAPAEIMPAEGLRFKGLRDIYTRDGFGSDFVEVSPPLTSADDIPWREPEYASITGALVFDGTTLNEVLVSRQVRLLTKDPYRDESISVGGRSVPMAANFTAAYGIWLARSGFATQSIRSLLGREGGITTPRILLMQPYDPDHLIIVMLHGLASSPEAWINVSNEVMGDEDLRRRYQVWEVYYPTNAPVAVNLARIRQALDATLKHFDPSGAAPASQNMVLVGHSMGGVIARLLVSSSGERLWQTVPVRSQLDSAKRARLRERLGPYLQFTPMPQVTRAIFLASPHRGTPLAQHRLARWIRNLIRAPAILLSELASLSDVLQGESSDGAVARVPNSIDNLSDTDPFIVASAALPISPSVRYHTIIGIYKSAGPLENSSDGVVPYTSAHLAGADSELAIASWHSVQETPAAILELRRILRLHAAQVPAG